MTWCPHCRCCDKKGLESEWFSAAFLRPPLYSLEEGGWGFHRDATSGNLFQTLNFKKCWLKIPKAQEFKQYFWKFYFFSFEWFSCWKIRNLYKFVTTLVLFFPIEYLCGFHVYFFICHWMISRWCQKDQQWNATSPYLLLVMKSDTFLIRKVNTIVRQ